MIRLICFRFLCTIIIILSLVINASGCVILSADEVYTVTKTQWEVYKEAIDEASPAGDTGIFTYTAPVQIRSWLAVMAAGYTSMAWTHSSALDFFGRKTESDNLRRCDATTADEQVKLEEHSREAFSYAYLWALQIFVPEWSTAITTYATSIGADLAKCPTTTSTDCSVETAVGMARYIVDEVIYIFSRDGWNAAGLSRTYNTRPYEDWRPLADQPDFSQLCTSSYRIKNQVCNILDLRVGIGEEVCWREQVYPSTTNPDYFICERYHLPHIADTARSYFLGRRNLCDRIRISYPCYDLRSEATTLLSRLASLDDTKKVQSEFFDNFFEWFDFFITENFNADFRSDQFNIIRDITALSASMYESTIVIWRTKIDNGVIRPSSYINTVFENEIVNSYQGPETKTSGSILGKEWVPYLKDEPTAEYPSHMSCLCSVLTSGMQRLSGINIIGTGEAVSVTKSAGSSTIETEKPDIDITLDFTSWASVESMCQESRMNGGTNYPKAVTDAKIICDSLTATVLDFFDDLTDGTVPSFIIDYQNLPVRFRRCNRLTDSLLSIVGVDTPAVTASSSQLRKSVDNIGIEINLSHSPVQEDQINEEMPMSEDDMMDIEEIRSKRGDRIPNGNIRKRNRKDDE